MVSPESKHFDLKPLAVALLCLLGAGTGAYWLYQDFNRSAGEGLGPSMARIERREAKVRRKPSKSFAWNNAQQDEKLFRRDSVQTSVGSAASIRFNDGTLLELGENSLVVIEDIQNLSLDFLKGAVVLHTAEGDKRVTMGADGKARFEELPIRLLKPEPLARYFTQAQESKAIHFAWKPRPGHEAALPRGLVLELSRDRGFRDQRLKQFAVKDPAVLETELALSEGDYFWRLAAGGKPLTEAAQFRVIAAAPLLPVSPGDNEMLRNYGDETATPFTWAAPDDSGAAAQVTHEIQVSRDAGFASIAVHHEISATSGAATLRDLPEGVLYWRIRSRYGDLQIVSRSERFAMVKAQKPELVLNLPEDQKTLERLPSLHFSWTSDAQGLEYGLQVKDSQDKVLEIPRTRSTGTLLKAPAPGHYRWRVVAYHGNEAVGETDWRAFSLFEGARFALRAPGNGRELYSWDKPVSFDFEWDKDPWLADHPEYSYQVVVSRTAEFTDLKEQKLGPRLRETSVAGSKLALGSGQYFWKVLVVDASGQTVKSSDVWRFAYGLPPALQAPVGAAPARQAIFNLVDKPENPVASWEEVKDADAYEVTLYALDPGRATAAVSPDGVPAGSRVVFQTVTSKTKIELKGLEPAHYVWSVRAVDRSKRKGQAMQPWPFSITYGEVLSAPKIISPEVQ